MLMDIVSMPDPIGLPLSRQLDVHVGRDLKTWSDYQSVYWPLPDGPSNQYRLGSQITAMLHPLIKVIDISPNDQFIFETVLGRNGSQWRCLYSKCLSRHQCLIGVSLPTIRLLRADADHLANLSHLFFRKTSDGQTPFSDAEMILSQIAPVIFSQDDLWSYIGQLSDIKDFEMPAPYMGLQYKPFYTHAPHVMHALVDGVYLENPYEEIGQRHLHAHVIDDQRFLIPPRRQSYPEHTHINHPDFDDIACNVVKTRPNAFTLSCLISHAWDGISDLWSYQYWSDPYQLILTTPYRNDDALRDMLVSIFHRSVIAYCHMFHISPNVFLSGLDRPYPTESKMNHDDHDHNRLSSVTVSKTLYDEMLVTIHDTIHGNYVSFYTEFTALAMATRSVGWWFH